MNFFKKRFPFFLLLFLGFIVLLLLIINIFFRWHLTNLFLSLLAVFILVGIVFLFLKKFIIFSSVKSVDEFAKTLRGGLFHFKCPSCKGVFAIKKSRGNNKKPLKMKCPHCNKLGVVSGKTNNYIVEEIPEKKSLATNFKCIKCKEGLTIWAEGGSLHHNVEVYSCPYCGEEKTLKKI